MFYSSYTARVRVRVCVEDISANLTWKSRTKFWSLLADLSIGSWWSRRRPRAWVGLRFLIESGLGGPT